MTDTELGKEGIDRSDLYAGPPAAISQVRCPDVIVAIRDQQGQSRKPVQNLFAGFRTLEALKKLLKDQACREDCLAGFDCANERPNFWCRRWRIAPQRK